MADQESSSKKRLDVYLMEKGLASSRTHAQELIDAGQVFLIRKNERKNLTKASFPIDISTSPEIIVENGAANRYVSRGGLKLEGALTHLNFSVSNLNVLDVGISTGGFTDCLLQQGASTVLGVDVGHGQVHSSLLSHPRLKILEGINARSLATESAVLPLVPEGKFDLAVMDVSFISITLIVPQIAELLKVGGCLLSLVKPQFEVGIDGLSKGGIVKNVALYADVETKVKDCCLSYGFQILDYFSSPIQGKDGNNEFFVFAKKIT